MAEFTSLRWHCRNSYVIAPPSRTDSGDRARWLRDPASFQLPDGVLMLEALADACEEIG